MTSGAKRPTLMIGVAALLAVVAGSVVISGPAATAKKPKEPGDPRAFKVTATLEPIPLSLGYTGAYEATGAIEGSGKVHCGIASIDHKLSIDVDGEWIVFQLDEPIGGQFITAAPEGLTGSGACSRKMRDTTVRHTLNGTLEP